MFRNTQLSPKVKRINHKYNPKTVLRPAKRDLISKIINHNQKNQNKRFQPLK